MSLLDEWSGPRPTGSAFWPQDRLAIDLLVANAPLDRHPANDTSGTPVERRAQPRPERLEWRHAQNREKGRSLQFAAIAAFVLILAACAYGAVSKTLSKPLANASIPLGKPR